MRFLDLKAAVVLIALFTYSAMAAFYPVNRGMVNQATVVTNSGGTTTFVATSNQIYLFEGSSNQTAKLPDATALPLDWWYEIVNNSTGTVTVNDNAGTAVDSLGASQVGHYQLRARASAAGTWKTWPTVGQGDVYLRSQHISSSTGASDASKPIITNSSGLVDDTFLPASAANAWSRTGNSGLTAGTHFLGTNDGVDLVFKTNAVEYFRITSAGALDTALTAGIMTANSTGVISATTLKSADIPDNASNTQGNAATASAFAANPSDCGAGTKATAIAANGNLTCTAVDLTADVSSTLPVANGGTGTGTAFTLGSVVFAGASGVYSQNNASFFWDNSNSRLGIGTASPGTPLDIVGIFTSRPYGTSTGETGTVQLRELAANGTHVIGLRAADSMTSNTTYTLPAVDGSNGHVLKTNGAGVLSFGASSGSFTSTEWTSFTPTGAWTTNVTYTGHYRRVGDTMEVRVRVAATGGTDAGQFTITLPSVCSGACSIDTAKIPAHDSSNIPIVGIGAAWDTGTAVYHLIGSIGSDATKIYWRSCNSVAASDLTCGTHNNSVPFTIASGDYTSYQFSVPISGWTNTN